MSSLLLLIDELIYFMEKTGCRAWVCSLTVSLSPAFCRIVVPLCRYQLVDPCLRICAFQALIWTFLRWLWCSEFLLSFFYWSFPYHLKEVQILFILKWSSSLVSLLSWLSLSCLSIAYTWSLQNGSDRNDPRPECPVASSSNYGPIVSIICEQIKWLLLLNH